MGPVRIWRSPPLPPWLRHTWEDKLASKFYPAHGVGLHPVHAVLLASILPLYLGALLSDLAYGATYEIQWTNFASWLIAGALLFTGLALAWSVVDMVRADRRWRRRSLLYLLLIAATFVIGAIDVLVHAKDAWATMPEATIFSVLVTILAVAAIWAGFSIPRAGDVR